MKFTQQEDDVILSKISQSPTNLQFAFENAARELEGRDRKSCEQRYYNTLRKKDPVHSLATANGFAVNIKNTPMKADEGYDLRKEIMMDILSKMTKKEKKEVISIILKL